MNQHIIILLRRQIYRFLTTCDRIIGRRDFPVVIFCYHSIASDTWRFSISESVFEQQLEYLLEKRKPITVQELKDHLSGERVISKPSFLITFDDGYRDILSVGDYLQKKDIKPLLFVLSHLEQADFIQLGTKRDFLTTPEIVHLKKSGWQVGSHSATHQDFFLLDESEVIKEIYLSKKVLEKQLGFAVEYFAYPRGRYTKDILKAVEKAGYECAFSMDDGMINERVSRFTLPRVGVDKTHSLDEFKTIFSPTVIQFRSIVKSLLSTINRVYF